MPRFADALAAAVRRRGAWRFVPGDTNVVHKALLALLLVSAAQYWPWRVTHTATADSAALYHVALAAELLFGVVALSFYAVSLKASRHAERPLGRGWSVDIFITTLDEDVALLRDTLVAAAAIRYPHTTYLLDDGARASVQRLALELGARYVARPGNDHAKAGNLNHGLGGSEGELLLVLDADHVPMPDILDSLVGFFDDERVALVQARQDFYNLDSFQHDTNRSHTRSSQEQALFFSVVQPGRDRYNATIYCGSPALIRRRALEAVGGFALGTITEDIHTGLRLQKAGWRTIYHNVTVARGLAPQTFTAFAVQWKRWGRGFMQMLARERVFAGSSLTVGQRLCYLDSLLFYGSGYLRLLLFVLPCLCLLTGLQPFAASTAEMWRYFLPYYAANLLLAAHLQGGFRAVLNNERLNALKFPILMASVRGLIGPSGSFRVTPKSSSPSARHTHLVPQLALAAFATAALAVGAYRVGRAAGTPSVWPLIANAAWVGLNLDLLSAGLYRALLRSERRGLFRFPVAGRLTMTILDGGPAGAAPVAAILNLSRQGAAIALDRPLPIGTALSVLIPLPEGTIQCAATVARAGARGSHGFELGLHFDGGDARALDVLSRFLHGCLAVEQGARVALSAECR